MAHLPVLKSDHRTVADFIRLYDQAMVSYLEGLTPPRDLEWGLVYSDRAFAGSWEAQCILQGVIPSGIGATEILRQMQTHFSEQSVPLAAIALNPSAGSELIQSLEQELTHSAFVPHPRQVMQLSQQTPLDQPTGPWQIIPARAGYRHLEDLAKAISEESGQSIQPEVLIAHLDDPRLDAILILQEGRPIGYGDLLSMGQTGVIMQMLLTAQARQAGVDRVILGQLIELAGRSQFRHILAGVDAADTGTLALLASAGFAAAGAWTLWRPRGA